jgi:hypothetical protein
MEAPIIVVSGLPRSGTSMMMQMLKVSGVDLVMDDTRKPDLYNTRGYYEYEKVKEIKKDTSWLDGIQGKAVKIISQLLYHLPESHQYKIIFMQRNMEEIISSQNKMLSSRGRGSDVINDTIMAEKFERHLEKIRKWIVNQGNIECLYIHYNNIIEDPIKTITKLNDFFDNQINIRPMLKVIDKSLYRIRKDNQGRILNS